MSEGQRISAGSVDAQLTPTRFVDDILSACDPSNWDADSNKGDYFRGLRDAYEAIHEIANEYQAAMYAWRKVVAASQDEHLKYRGETDFELERLRSLLAEINNLIFANGAPVGSDAYFKIREIAAGHGSGAQPQGAWRPIDTAPKDGSRIVVGRDMGTWGFVRGIAYWEDIKGISGWVTTAAFSYPPGVLGLGNPTHWLAASAVTRPNRETEPR